MGHIRLGVLPTSKKWNRVVEVLRLGADVSEIASATAAAAETSLENASADPAFLHAFWLLTQIPLAARGPEFIEDLRARPCNLQSFVQLGNLLHLRLEARYGVGQLGEIAALFETGVAEQRARHEQ